MTKAIERGVSNSGSMISALGGLAAVALLLAPVASWAANTLEAVRVGKHADKTRVVFQLSGPTGYQVEQINPAPGISEIKVAFEASGRVTAPALPPGITGAVPARPPS